MRLLLDTHLLLWAASIWEIAINSSLGREDFRLDARMFRTALLNNDYVELPITGQHVAAVAPLPLPLPIRYDRRSGKRRAGGAGHTGGT